MHAEVRMGGSWRRSVFYRTGKVTCEAAADWLGMERAPFPATSRPLRGRRGRRDHRPAARPGVWSPGAGGQGRVGDRPVHDPYFDFTVKHFHEEIAKRGFVYSYSWTKMVLQRSGLVRPKRKRSAHRKKRLRRPLPGMMLFQDGSTHEWLTGGRPLDLIVTLDDATAEIYSIFLVEQEGTASSFRGPERDDRQEGSVLVVPTPTAAAITSSPPRPERRCPSRP